jgi:hypothetical protein
MAGLCLVCEIDSGLRPERLRDAGALSLGGRWLGAKRCRYENNLGRAAPRSGGFAACENNVVICTGGRSGGLE